MKTEVDKYKYIADDGSVFYSKPDCIKDEKFLNNLKAGEKLMIDNPCIAVFVNDQIKKAKEPANELTKVANCSCGYDSWQDNQVIAKAYSTLSQDLYKLMEKFEKLSYD
jgi:hypothetical protein